MLLGYATLTQLVKTWFIRTFGDDSGGGENAFIEQEITTN